LTISSTNSSSSICSRLSDPQLATFFLKCCATFPERTFFYGTRLICYQEAGEHVRRLAGAMQSMGIEKGDRVLIIASNRPEGVLFAFGAATIGAIFGFLHPGISKVGFASIVKQLAPKLILVDVDVLPMLTNCVDSARLIWTTSPCDETLGMSYGQLLTLSSAYEGRPIGGCQDPIGLFFTSGSTGVPRTIRISHTNILFSVNAIQNRLGYRPTDRIGCYLPLSFDYGLYQCFLAANAGAGVVFGQPAGISVKWLAELVQNRISILPGIPMLFKVLSKLLERHFHPLPDLKMATNTGGRISPVIVDRLTRMLPQLKFYSMYGLTECKRVSILLPSESLQRPDSVGRPIEGTDACIIDDQGMPCPVGKIGELVVRGPHVALGYWDDGPSGHTRFDIDPADGRPCLFTGDWCRMDNEGFLYFVGRRDRLMKHRGFRIHPLEIEKAALTDSGVAEAVVLQTESPERLILFVVVTTGRQEKTTSESIAKLLNTCLEPFKIPDRILILDALPRNPHGKIDRESLAEMVRSI
jgi:acyl-coenzyme A synthetase/AMP-(fatty) acid ligase